MVPYFGYARQDRKVSPRVPISAKLVADLICTAGASRVMTMELHAGQIQGFFNVPVDNLYSNPVLLPYISEFVQGLPLAVVSPDAGGVERARAYAKRLRGELAIIDKRRAKANVSEVMNIVGDVEGRDCVIVDDMIDTAGTLTNAAAALKERGAKRILASATHPVCSGPAIKRIMESAIEEVVVTDTIPLDPKVERASNVEVLSVAEIFGEAIQRGFNNLSISSLFDVDKG